MARKDISEYVEESFIKKGKLDIHVEFRTGSGFLTVDKVVVNGKDITGEGDMEFGTCGDQAAWEILEAQHEEGAFGVEYLTLVHTPGY